MKKYIEYLGKMIPRKQFIAVVTKDEKCKMCKHNIFTHYLLDGYYDTYECENCGSVL